MTAVSPASLNRIVGAVLALAVAFTLGFVVRSQLPAKSESSEALEAAVLEVLRQATERRGSTAPEESAAFEAGFQPAPPGATLPVKVHSVSPEYTDVAREARLQGVVILRTAIDQEGNVADVRVLKGLQMGLTEAAVDAVKQWKFEPATIDGEPIPVGYNVTVKFQLGRIG